RVILTTRARFSDYLAAKIIVEYSFVLVQATLIVLIAYGLVGPFAGLRILWWGLPILFLSTSTWVSVGSLFGFAFPQEHYRSAFIGLLSLPLTFASTIFYSLSGTPIWIQALASVNPITYATDALRSGWFGSTDVLGLGVTAGIAILAVAVSVLVAARSPLLPKTAR
ncbi:membrane protein containing ABC-2 type transporter domain protein, partial [mine drainage metagenome]